MDELILRPHETPIINFKSFESINQQWEETQYFLYDPLTLPELANNLQVPTDYDFKYCYNDLDWRPIEEKQ